MNVAAYIAQRARQLGLDPRAVLAIARQEGLSGGVGDHGTSFGPFQLHIGGAMPRGVKNPQAWAESPAGINYALSRINSVAHGLHGAQAIAAISRRFERPANPAAEIAGAIRDYGKGVGSSPALQVSQMLSGGAHHGESMGAALGLDPNQLLGSYMIAQANAQLSGQPNSVQAEGQGLLQMAMARKALQAASSSLPSGAASTVRGLARKGQVMQSGGFAGGFLPKGAVYKVGRKDQGQDGQTNPGGAILAPGSGVVLSVKSDPNGFGPAYPIVHFTSGPYAGKNVYIGHTISALRAGQKFSAGTVLSHTGTHPLGNASVPGWFEIGFAPGGLPGQFGQAVPF